MQEPWHTDYQPPAKRTALPTTWLLSATSPLPPGRGGDTTFPVPTWNVILGQWPLLVTPVLGFRDRESVHMQTWLPASAPMLPDMVEKSHQTKRSRHFKRKQVSALLPCENKKRSVLPCGCGERLHARKDMPRVTVVPRVPILFNRPHLGTTDISIFSGICFSTYFTIQFILIHIYIGI